MGLFGAHMSVAGGLANAVERITRVGGECLQIFTKNQRRWESAPLTDADAEAFRAALADAGGMPVASHGSYLVNPAASDELIAARSIANMADELTRCDWLGVEFLIIHPGAHLGCGVEEGIALAASRIDEALERSGVTSVRILLENTAGQGTWLGGDFAQLAGIINASRHSDLLGVCLDTAHAFGAGYDIRSNDGYADLFSSLDSSVGLKRLGWFHLNDSLAPLGSHRDRHTHIGEGEIGLSGFELLVNDRRFEKSPMALETPKEEDLADDARNIATLRGLVKTNRGW